jgi:phenylpropionate dioxygenase-like ring-hydroxylating dioxygenase large terminal subunit
MSTKTLEAVRVTTRDGLVVSYLHDVLKNDPVLPYMYHVVAESDDINEHGSAISRKLMDLDLAIWRTPDHEVHVAQNLCFHRGARLVSETYKSSAHLVGEGDTCGLQCPYHGFRYDGDGACIYLPSDPSRRPPKAMHLNMFHAIERFGWIWVCLGEPKWEIPSFPEWEDPTFTNISCGPFFVQASATRVNENVQDPTHFPFVHIGTLGDPAHTRVGDYNAPWTKEKGVITSEILIWQPDPDGYGVGKSVSYVYKVPSALTTYFAKSGDPEHVYSMFFAFTPISADETAAWMFVNQNYGDQSPDEVRTFQSIVFQEDCGILESQRPELLPLNHQQVWRELSVPADRITVSYREYLEAIGIGRYLTIS